MILLPMKNLSSTADNTKPVINMSGTDIPNPADFSDLEVTLPTTSS